MNEQVDLIWLSPNGSIPTWPLGQVSPAEYQPAAVHEQVEKGLKKSNAQAWLFWDSTLEEPKPERVLELMSQPGNVWHGGLQLGTAGLPGLIDFVAPFWMLNRDPDVNIEATSWRLSPRACLVRTTVLRQLGSIRPAFVSLDAAFLEMGHRFVERGALARHVPWLVQSVKSTIAPTIPLEDELRFIYYRFGAFWSKWALGRAVLSGYAPPMQIISAWRRVVREAPPVEPDSFRYDERLAAVRIREAQVSVLIPTLNRYSYLFKLLDQLRQQTIKPHEIILVDQTEAEKRDTSIAGRFPDLPLKVIYLDQAGQCSSRNDGLCVASGDFVLFIDDDDEVSPTLIELHLRNLQAFRVDVSSGVADEVGAGSLPDNFKYVRASDVFPTNNTMVRREVLSRSGLFDLAYDRGDRADGDLGMRVYLSGAAMVLNPKISVLHHHASIGGLRAHKARAITYAKSRNSMTTRQMPSATQIYMAKRYFTVRQVREMLWLSVFGTFKLRKGGLKQAVKALISLIYLPDTLWRVRTNSLIAKQMFEAYPQIAKLVDSVERRQVVSNFR